MNKYLILVKHSLPEIEKDIPARKWQLSVEGYTRAQRLAEELRRYQPETILSSVEPKAMETARTIAREFGLEHQSLEGLHEHDRSNVPFLSKDQFEMGVKEFFEKPNILVFGNETANQCQARFNKAIHFILNCHTDETVAVVTHGTVISLFVSRLIGIPGLPLWHDLGLPSFLVIDMKSNVLIAQENII